MVHFLFISVFSHSFVRTFFSLARRISHYRVKYWQYIELVNRRRDDALYLNVLPLPPLSLSYRMWWTKWWIANCWWKYCDAGWYFSFIVSICESLSKKEAFPLLELVSLDGATVVLQPILLRWVGSMNLLFLTKFWQVWTQKKRIFPIIKRQTDARSRLFVFYVMILAKELSFCCECLKKSQTLFVWQMKFSSK